MPYYTDGGVYDNSEYNHFKHLFAKDLHAHTAVPTHDVVVKGIFTDAYAEIYVQEKHSIENAHICHETLSESYAADPADEKMNDTSMEYMVSNIHEQF